MEAQKELSDIEKINDLFELLYKKNLKRRKIEEGTLDAEKLKKEMWTTYVGGVMCALGITHDNLASGSISVEEYADRHRTMVSYCMISTITGGPTTGMRVCDFRKELENDDRKFFCPVCNDDFVIPKSEFGDPKKNLYSLCSICCSILYYERDKSEFRLATEEEILVIPDHIKSSINRIRANVKKMREGSMS